MFVKLFSIKLLVVAFLLEWNLKNALAYVDQSNATNLNLSVAIDFIIKSANATEIRFIGCDKFFNDDFKIVTQSWIDKVAIQLINIHRKHVSSKLESKNILILIFGNQIDYSSLLPYVQKNRKLRKNKIVFISKSTECANEELFEQIRLIWSVKILNFIVLRDCKMNIDVYTYLPYANKNCREFKVENVVKMGEFSNKPNYPMSFVSEYTFNVHEYDTYPSSTLPFFPNKIPMNLNKCEIIVSAYIWPPNVIDINSKEPGIEIDFIRTIGRQMNGNVSIILSKNPELGVSHGPEEKLTGRLAYLQTEVVDLMLPVPSQTNVLRDLDTSECYLRNAVTFIVPAAGSFPSSMILWAVIEKLSNLFLMVVGAVIIISIVINLMIKVTSKVLFQSNSSITYLHNIFTALLRSLIETSTPTLPSHRMIQWIYGLWFAACLIINCYFNTTLTSFFTEPGQIRQIETVQQIINSKMQISFFASYLPLTTVDSVELEYFKSRNTNVSVLVGLKKASTGKAATFTDVSRAEHITVQWVSSSGRKPIYYVRGKNYLSYWNNLAMYRGNVLFDRINNLVRRINKSGYWHFQVKRYYNRRLIQIMVRQYLMVYNYQHGLCNKVLINRLNQEFRDSNMIDLRDETEKCFVIETNEHEIIQRFFRTDKTLVTWSHLSTVFKLWGIGIGLATVTFVGELLHFKYSNTLEYDQ